MQYLLTLQVSGYCLLDRIISYSHYTCLDNPDNIIQAFPETALLFITVAGKLDVVTAGWPQSVTIIIISTGSGVFVLARRLKVFNLLDLSNPLYSLGYLQSSNNVQ